MEDSEKELAAEVDSVGLRLTFKISNSSCVIVVLSLSTFVINIIICKGHLGMRFTVHTTGVCGPLK